MTAEIVETLTFETDLAGQPLEWPAPADDGARYPACASQQGLARCNPNTTAVRWTQDDSGRVHTPFEPIVLAATLALIPVLIIEADTTSDGWRQFADAGDGSSQTSTP